VGVMTKLWIISLLIMFTVSLWPRAPYGSGSDWSHKRGDLSNELFS